MEFRVCGAEQRLGTLVSKFSIPVGLEIAGADFVDFSCSADVGEVEFIWADADNGAYIQSVLYIQILVDILIVP